jgi:hypothetical protein
VARSVITKEFSLMLKTNSDKMIFAEGYRLIASMVKMHMFVLNRNFDYSHNTSNW